MTNSKGWLAVLLGVLALGAGWVSLDFHPTAATGAPLAQATATSTNTPQAPTSTPLILDGPGTVSLGGQVVVGVVATRGAAGTPAIYEPVKTDGSGRLQMAAAPSGAVAAQTPVAVQGIASEAHIGQVGGANVQVAATMVLPAQTPVAYAALDVMANSASSPVVVTFAGMCRVNGGSGFILKARQMTDQSTNVAAVRWQLYHTTPTAINDNSPFTLLYTNNTNRVGYIDLPANATEGTGSTAAAALNGDVRMAYKCAANDTALYMIPETLTAFTPASAQGWTFELTAAQN